MRFRFRRTRHIFRALAKIYPGTFHGLYGTGSNVLGSVGSPASWVNASCSIYRRQEFAGRLRQRFSTVPETKPEIFSSTDILSFIRSSLHKPRGPFHCWLNTCTGNKDLFKEDGIFLVLIDEYVEGSLEANQNSVKMFEKAKSLQQRYPSLQVLTLQCGNSVCLSDISMHLAQRLVKEYIVFPVLLSKKIFEDVDVPCHIISKGLQNPMVYSGVDVDLKVLDRAIYDLNAENGKESLADDKKSPWVKPIEIVKEPDICSASRNLLFSFPGCISVDENGNRLFLSDVNHHRIIVFNNTGKVLDAIGSSPGYEDGEFEIAKLRRPAASFYHDSEDCLYFVDSENHAIRRADMERRVVETFFPVPEGSKNKVLWRWIMDKIWTKKSTESKSEEFDSKSFLFPWHILRSSNNDLLVLNQSFETLWIVDIESGHVKEVVKESSKILEICGQMILERCVPLNHLPSDWLERQASAYCSFEGLPYAGLMSSVAMCNDEVVFCDTVGQVVVKLAEGSGSVSCLQFSDFGILGLPYWLQSSLERVYAVDGLSGVDLDHSESFRLLPGSSNAVDTMLSSLVNASWPRISGRVDIELNVDIPPDTDIVEMPQEGCIWRQARGAAAEVSGIENKAASVEKAGLAQQWYDEIDSYTFSISEDEPSAEEESRPPIKELPEGRVRIGCTINTSPGTGEAIIYAALYLRLKNSNLQDDTRGNKAAKLADKLDSKGKSRKKLLAKMLTMSDRDMEEVVFVRPLHVRLKFITRDRPKEEKSRKEILTDSCVKVYVKL